MKSYRRPANGTAGVISAIMLLVITLFYAEGVQAAPQYEVTCSSCHVMPPLDSTGNRDATTGAFKGNHQTHAGTEAVTCTNCHGTGVLTYGTGHRTKVIQGSANINNSPAVGTYSRAFSNQSSVPPTPLGTCSNVNCHFERTSPAWGTASLVAPSFSNCDVCHDALPTSNKHTVHIAEHGNNLNACTYCHTDHTVEAKPFQHATSVGNRPIAILDAHGYLGSDNQYLPSQSLGGRTFGSCNTASCHNDGRGTLIGSPPWDATVAKCSVCHPSRPMTGNHPEHMASPNVVCASCHNGAVESTTVSTSHGNNLIDVYKTTAGDLGYPPAKAIGSPPSSCSAASCHINPSNSGQQVVTPVWGDINQTRCVNCHAGRPATGSHPAHFDAGVATCSNCHNGAVEGTTLSANHTNNMVDVYKTAPGDLGYPTPKAIGSAYGICSTSSCHDDGRGNPVPSPTWGTVTPNCTACHASLPNTGSHVQHITGVGVTCGNCHKGAVQSTTASLLHMNGFVDVYKNVEGDMGYPAQKAKGSQFLSCTTVNCHGRLSPVWGANTPNYQCTKCHGLGTVLANYSTSTNQQAAPGYMGTGLGVGRQTGTVVNNVSNDPKVGAHDAHMRSLNNLGKPTACSDCHVVPATAFVSGHMNGSALPTWSNLVKNVETIPNSALPYTYKSGALTTAYDSGTGTCSNTYCHGATLPGGTDKAPKWTDGTYLTGDRAIDCAKCHGYPPVTSTRYPHAPAEAYMTCTGCHPHDGTRQSTDPLAGNDFHMNGNLEANKYCNSCHDYDTRGTNGEIWGKSQMAVESWGAHAMHINYLKKRMNVTTMDSNVDHYGSVNFDGICGVCHSRDENDHHQTDRTSNTRHINFGDAANRAARQFGPNPSTYNGTAGTSSAFTPKTCSNVDCHYKQSPIWQPY